MGKAVFLLLLNRRPLVGADALRSEKSLLAFEWCPASPGTLPRGRAMFLTFRFTSIVFERKSFSFLRPLSSTDRKEGTCSSCFHGLSLFLKQCLFVGLRVFSRLFCLVNYLLAYLTFILKFHAFVKCLMTHSQM